MAKTVNNFFFYFLNLINSENQTIKQKDNIFIHHIEAQLDNRNTMIFEYLTTDLHPSTLEQF